MKILVLVLGLLGLAGSVNGQNQTPNSRNPGDRNSKEGLVVQSGHEKKTAKFNWWAAQRAFSKRQNKGREALENFHRELEQEQIVYHRRMIYQIKQARKLERRHRKNRYANPNYCYPSGKLGLKRRKFR